MGEMPMNNKKKLLLAVVAVVCVISLTALYFLNYNSQKRFSYSEKNSVAMGTIVSQKVYGDYSAKHIEKITALINGLDSVISWREDDSLVARLNKGETAQSREVAAIIKKCGEISSLSGGVFDITVGGVVKLWNIGEETERVPESYEIEAELKDVDYTKINIDGDSTTLGENIEIDLGAVGKGAACDNVMTYLKASDVKGAVVSVGGSIVAYGDYNKRGDKWKIAVKHPRSDSGYLGIISLDEGFVSTSGDYERYFEKDGKRYHHIIDATTGYPSDSGLISVTVVCGSGILSDALSTVCFILGEDKSEAILERYGASAIFVDSDMNISIVGDIDFEY